MAPFNRRLGKRGGRPDRQGKVSPLKLEHDDRPSATRKGHPDRPSRPVDSMILASEAVAPFNAYSEVQETAEDHIVPRQSITDRQLLGLIPMVETETRIADVAHYQRDTVSGEMIRTTDPVKVREVTWRRDATLLKRARVEQLNNLKVRRQTSRSKRLITEVERPAVEYIENEIDDVEIQPTDKQSR